MRFVNAVPACACAVMLSVACGDGASGVTTTDNTGGGSSVALDRHRRPISLPPSNAGGNDAGATTTPADAGATATPADAGDEATTAPDAGITPPPAPDAGGAPPSSSGSVGGSVPTVGGCAIYPADNPFNTRIDDTSKFAVHPQSSTYIANMSAATHLHADWGDWSINHYGIPWQTVPGSQAMVPMTFSTASESDPGPYPFPSGALVEGGSGSGGDMHVLVLDTGSCALFETYASTYVGPGWSCGSGAKFDLTSNALRPAGWTSSDAAGLPILPGLVRLSEVTAGAIHHALRFTVAKTQQGYIPPATHAAGSSNMSLPPMGLRVRLRATVDLSAYSGPGKVILTAMQQYGMILADNGSNWFVSGDSDDGWAALMDAVGTAFAQVHGSDFEAVDTGPITTAGL